jgi:hypothetical protein
MSVGELEGEATRDPFKYTRYEETGEPPSFEGAANETVSELGEVESGDGALNAAGIVGTEAALTTAMEAGNIRNVESSVTVSLA